MKQIIKKETGYLTMEIATTAKIHHVYDGIICLKKYYTSGKVHSGPDAKDEILRIVKEQQAKIKDLLKKDETVDIEMDNSVESFLRIEPIKEVFDVFPDNAITEFIYGRKEGWHPIHLNERSGDIDIAEYSYEIDMLSQCGESYENDDLPF